jgi:hypothetical protein
MCDIFEGQLILCVRRFDPVGRRLIRQLRDGDIDHVDYIESMEDRLERLQLRPREEFDVSLHRVAVPAGQETWKANYLQAYYKGALLRELSDNGLTPDLDKTLSSTAYHFVASPNHRLSVVASGAAGGQVSARAFSVGPHHASYKSA